MGDPMKELLDQMPSNEDMVKCLEKLRDWVLDHPDDPRYRYEEKDGAHLIQFRPESAFYSLGAIWWTDEPKDDIPRWAIGIG